MAKFIVLSFLVLAFGFYELSGGADFEPELRAPIAVAETTLAPIAPTSAATPEVTRANNASLIQIALPASAQPAIAELAVASRPLPAGEVIITPAPDLPVAETTVAAVAAPSPDDVSQNLRAVAGDWVNMRSGPSTNYGVLETLPRGTQAEVLEVDADGWARIRVSSTGQIGWMAERLLSDI